MKNTKNIFSGILPTVKIYVPDDYMLAYQNATYWSVYTD